LIVGDALSARLFLSGSSREVAGPSEAGQWRGKPRKHPHPMIGTADFGRSS